MTGAGYGSREGGAVAPVDAPFDTVLAGEGGTVGGAATVGEFST